MNREDLRLLLSDFPLVEKQEGELEGVDAAFYATFHRPGRPAEIGRYVLGQWSSVITVDEHLDRAETAHSSFIDGESTSYAPGHEEGNGYVESLNLDAYLRGAVLQAQAWTHVLLRDARELRRRERARIAEERGRVRRRRAVDVALLAGLGLLLWMWLRAA